MKPYLPLFLASFAIMATSCSSGETVTSIAFDKTAYSLAVNETVQVKIRYVGSGKTAKFFSSDDLIARIDEKGNLTGVGKGEATIFAVCNDIIARAMVMVSAEEDPEAIYKTTGTMSLHANMSAFGIVGTLESPFTFIAGSDPLKTAYFAHDIPNKELLEAALNFLDSPFIQENPDYEIPAAYEDYKAAITALLEQPGPYSAKHVLKDEKITSYFFSGEDYVSQAGADVAKYVAQAKIVSLVAHSNLSALTFEDLVKLAKDRLAEGEKTYESKELNLLFGALSNASYATKNTEDFLGLTITVGEGFGSCLTTYFDGASFGDIAAFKSLVLSADIEKKAGHYAISTLSAELQATLFGQNNVFTAEIAIPDPKEKMPSDTLDKIIAELEGNSQSPSAQN